MRLARFGLKISEKGRTEFKSGRYELRGNWRCVRLSTTTRELFGSRSICGIVFP